MASTNLDPGRVVFVVHTSTGGVRTVEVVAHRPDLTSALGGMSSTWAMAALPMLYAICGKAQGAAARLAVSAARGAMVAPCIDPEVLNEARREHLWRLLLDWSVLLGLPDEKALVAEGQRSLARGDFETWAASRLREPLSRLEAAFATLPAIPSAPGNPLPALTAEQTLALWPRLDEDFASRPVFRGEPAETGAWARHGGLESTIADRARARILELRDPGNLGRVTAVPVADGVGRSCVETARGLLMHEVTLDGDAVKNYRIVAPTEWNFHPQGMLRRWFAGVSVPRVELRTLAAQAVLALDPCVRHEIIVE